ncbi:MAG TPA: hypothetical protein VFK05_08365 [Polyangiaceae bacterium]|nr:hypothetical protein [Polyangiaceae bacterium]
MADDPIYSDEDVFEQAGAGLVATLTLAATSSGASLPVQGAMAMVGSLIGLGFGRSVYRAATRRFPLYAGGFLRAFDPDPTKAEEKARIAAEQEPTETLDETMMRSFRQMMDAVDPEVVPVLGYMTGLYRLEGKRANHFFRAFGRLLCELEPGELDDLQKIVRVAQRQSNHREDLNLELDETGKVWASVQNTPGQAVEAVPHAGRLFALLKREQLATNVTPGVPRYGRASPAADVTMSMYHVVLDEIARMLMLLSAPR